MKLYLVRHGKAEKSGPAMRDRDRPLRQRGERQSRWLGEAIIDLPPGLVPGLIVSSRFVRARDTAAILQQHFGCELVFDERLELGWPADDALTLIATAAESGMDAPLMLVGHNPQMEILLTELVPELAPDEDEMKTGMAALIELAHAMKPAGNGRLIRKMRLSDREGE